MRVGRGKPEREAGDGLTPGGTKRPRPQQQDKPRREAQPDKPKRPAGKDKLTPLCIRASIKTDETPPLPSPRSRSCCSLPKLYYSRHVLRPVNRASWLSASHEWSERVF